MQQMNLKNIYEWPILTRSLIIMLLCAVVFYLLYLWDISALKTQLANEQQKEQDLKQQLKLINQKEKKLEADTAQYQVLQQIYLDWKNKIIRYSQLPELLNEVLKIGATNHIYFSLFNPGEETKQAAYKKLPIKIVAVGSYHQLSAFLSQVANMNWVVVINNFTISKEAKNDVLGAKLAKQAGEQNLLTAELMFDVYHLPEKTK